MKIVDIINFLESTASTSLQEQYDNSGLIIGNSSWECGGIMCCLDATEKVVEDAIDKKCNLIVAHHPIIFGGLKKINGKNYVERAVITAIKNDIAIYAIHTNLDNVLHGVNKAMADKIGLIKRTVLLPKEGRLNKLQVFVPKENADALRTAIFAVGAGHIGNYSECSFNTEGIGTFNPGKNTKPHVGDPGAIHYESEIKFETIFPDFLKEKIIEAMLAAHPYEEVAYDIIPLANTYPQIGAGIIGELENELSETDFLQRLKDQFGIPVIRHSERVEKPIKKVAICGGAGSFLISNALASKADAFVTADLKYHEFFDANSRLLLADIGHYESEQFTIDLLHNILMQKFPNFAVLKTVVKTNPIWYC